MVTPCNPLALDRFDLIAHPLVDDEQGRSPWTRPIGGYSARPTPTGDRIFAANSE